MKTLLCIFLLSITISCEAQLLRKTYVVSDTAILLNIKAAYPWWGVELKSTIYLYEDLSRVKVIDGRFEDSLFKYGWGHMQEYAAYPLMPKRGILTYKCNMLNSEILE